MKYGIAILLLLGVLAPEESLARPANDPPVSSVGLPEGEKAPAFAARDQFDHEQSNETLKGSNGTVLLFFRSADW